MSNVSSYLPNLLGPVVLRWNDSDQTARGAINFVGGTVADNEANDSVDVTLGDFASSALRVANPLGTFWCTIAGSAWVADRVLTIPLLTGPDTLVVLALAQTLTNKTLTSPTIGGTPVITGTDLNDTSLTLCPIKIRKAQVQTTDATVTTLLSYTMTDETLAAFDVVVTAARRTGVTKGGRWKRSVVYRRTSAGAATIVGAIETGTDQETDAAWDVTIDTDGTNAVRVRVTGAAATNINWCCELRIQETLAT